MHVNDVFYDCTHSRVRDGTLNNNKLNIHQGGGKHKKFKTCISGAVDVREPVAGLVRHLTVLVTGINEADDFRQRGVLDVPDVARFDGLLIFVATLAGIRAEMGSGSRWQ